MTTGSAALQALFAAPGAPLVLDTRTRTAYQQRRLAGSVNIPLASLASSCFLLPDKDCAFAVVVPAPGSYSIVTQPACEQQQRGDHPVHLKGAASLTEFLSRWRVSHWLQDGEELWSCAAAQGVLECGAAGDTAAALARRCLFAPAPVLASCMDGIEAALLAAQQQPQQLCALDFGCGSGRDVMWLACRRLSSGARWRVTGVDAWLGALERAAQCAAAMQLTGEQVRLVFGRVCPQTGSIQQLDVPAGSSLHGSPYAARQGAAALQQAGACHLVVCSRVLVRALLPAIAQCLLAPGGWIVYHTFVDLPGVRAFGRPAGPEHLLAPGELAAQHFGPQQGFRVLRDDVVPAADGRELSWFVAQKLPAGSGG
jgi:rhodanese-related sulfurtransferase/SAM-dependent methyltransferase